MSRQEVLDATPGGHAVRLDVYVRDEAGSVFNVEMQTTDTRELAQRARYYHALMDLDMLSRGDSYSKIGDSIVIFICTFDPFGRDCRVYSFENICSEVEGLSLNDGTRTVFLSSASTGGRSGGALDEFLDYVASGEVTGDLSRRLDNGVAEVLDNKKWRLEFMKLEVRDQLNFDKGFEEGKELGKEYGEERLSRLFAALAKEGRVDDIVRASSDKDYRKTLFEEYKID